ncbi:eukaryotic translation initiation factor 4 gamma 1 [Pleuronectes platessa]|uniref:eukaryotic translation initiation factor 4 gamma 1 n=1 Tax=Pleuronectes platessa TaxID=8262 RepID=UPI00232A75B9|nr:eukaryotic translation initiation factor 4 gamma 1 [Pleuronectes platessa]
MGTYTRYGDKSKSPISFIFNISDLVAEERADSSLGQLFDLVLTTEEGRSAASGYLLQDKLLVEVQSLTDWSARVSFRCLLVKHCQAEHRKNFDREDISQNGRSCLEPVRDVRVIDRLREERNKAKPSCRFLNTIRFIGEQFISKVLGEKAMHCCIRRLLQNGDGPSLSLSLSWAPRLSLLLKDTVGARKRAGSTPH